MGKITFLGAGSTVFAKNIIGDCMLTPSLCEFEIALYDIDPQRLEDSYNMVCALNRNINENRSRITKHLGVENRKDALRGATFAVNAIQVGGYEPCTVTDFEIPKKYGLRQTIADTTGVGGIFRALRTIPVMEGIARDMEAVCPECLLINYTNPMAMVTGYMGRFSKIQTVGLCHSVQVCAHTVLKVLDIPFTEPLYENIAGINHMSWLLELRNGDGTDLYPEIRCRANLVLEGKMKCEYKDLVRLEYVRRLGYYVTESSEHSAEYNNFFIKNAYPELIEQYQIPLDEYLRRCVNNIEEWERERPRYISGDITHKKTYEYAAGLMEAVITDVPMKIGGNVINRGAIPNLPPEACVEVACLVNREGVQPCMQKPLPTICAAMNMTEINVQLLAIEAAIEQKRDKVYRAVMLDPHASSELTISKIVDMCDEMMEKHHIDGYMPVYH